MAEDAAPKEYEVPKGAETKGSWQGGKKKPLEYKATAKFYVLRKKEKPSAELFSVSYVADGGDKTRPVFAVRPGASGDITSSGVESSGVTGSLRDGARSFNWPLFSMLNSRHEGRVVLGPADGAEHVGTAAEQLLRQRATEAAAHAGDEPGSPRHLGPMRRPRARAP